MCGQEAAHRPAPAQMVQADRELTVTSCLTFYPASLIAWEILQFMTPAFYVRGTNVPREIVFAILCPQARFFTSHTVLVCNSFRAWRAAAGLPCR